MSSTDVKLEQSAVRFRTIWRLPVGLFSKIKNLLFGTLFCLTPFTAILALGWFARFSASVSRQHIDGTHSAKRPSTGWIMDKTRSSRTGYWLGGLIANLSDGLRMTAALAIMTLPFSLMWLGSWWAGWENSFNKGYEQAYLGPLVFLFASLVSAIVLSILPFAFCHVAHHRRFAAVFEWRTIYRLIRLASWRYVVVTIGFVFFALPLLASRALPVYYQDIIPGSADWGPERLEEFRGLITLIKAAYVFLSLSLFRYLNSKLYARALAQEGAQASRWQSVFGVLHGVLLLTAWGSFSFIMMLGQFMNMHWFLWVSHPFMLLPWMP